MAIFAISIAPTVGEGTSLSKYVAAAQKVLEEDGRVCFRLDPMFTTIEGEFGVCMEVCRKMHEAVAAMGALRIGTLIKIDDRRDKDVRMEDKIRSVEDKLK